MAVQLPDKFENIVVNAKQKWLDTRGMTRDELRSFIEKRVLRDQQHSPKVGDDAPDFVLEQLDKKGNRTDQTTRLSSHFGTPIALIFGSYT